MSSALFKSRVSSLNKLADLPRFRHPADLINEPYKQIKQQMRLINGEEEFGKGLYGNQNYENLMKNIVELRKSYSAEKNALQKTQITKSFVSSWHTYLTILTNQLPEVHISFYSIQEQKISPLQRNQIYQILLNAKQRNEERLSYNRFINFFDLYSRAFKFDIPFHPTVLMKLVYPHWGYLNNFPSTHAYRLTLDEIQTLFEELIVVSNLRENGDSLHSAEMFSFIFWKLYAKKFENVQLTGELSQKDFCQLLEFFKFKTTPESLEKDFEYSLQGESLKASGGHVRFDIWRRIFLERNL